MRGGDAGPGTSGLKRDEAQRLDRFARVFERLDASTYVTLADARESEAVERAKTQAQRIIGMGPRRAAVRDAIRAFTDAAAAAYSRRTPLPDTVLMYSSLPDTAEDRVRFLASVERAVVGLLLWDELDEDEREALLGPWSAIVGSIA